MRAEIEHRPFVSAGIGMVLGILCLQHVWAIGVLAAFAILIRPVFGRAALAIGFLIGAAVSPRSISPERVQHEMPARLWMGVVSSQSSLYETSEATMVQTKIGLLRVTTDFKLDYGDEIEFRGAVLPLREGTERASSMAGVVGRVRAEPGSVHIRRTGPAAFRWGDAWRRSYLEFCQRTMDRRSASALSAITFNIDEGLHKDFRENLQRTGTIHIISASGAHVMIFAVSLAFLLSAAPVPRPVQLSILILVLGVYALAAGFRPPIVRAVLMAAIGYGAYLFRKEPDLPTALAIALVGYLAWSPISVYDIGMQLSFVTVGALALFCRFEALDPEYRWMKRLVWRSKQLLHASFVAWVASAPLVAYYFGMFSWISVPANFAICGLIAPAMMTSLGAHAISFFVPSLGVGLMAGFAAPLIASIESIVQSLGSWPFAATTVPAFSGWWIPALYIGALMLWRQHVRQAA